MDVVLISFVEIVQKFCPIVTWSLPMDQNECGCVQWTNRPQNVWLVPWSSATIRALGEFGVLQTVRNMVHVEEHGPGDEPLHDNNVRPLKPKRTQLEGIDYPRHTLEGQILC